MKSNKNEMWKIYLGVMFSACICGKAQCTTSCSPCTNMDGAVYCEKNCPPAYFEIELLLTACNTSVINTTTSPSELTTPNGLPVSENEKQSTPSSDHSTTSIDSAVGGNEAIASLVICAPCDNACADCSGPGPENCTSCAEGYIARGYNAEGYEAGLTMRSTVILCVILSGAYPSTVDSTLLVVCVTSGLLTLLVVLTIGLLLRKRRRRHREIMGDTVVGASSTESARAPNATSSDNPEVPESASADTLNDHNFTTRRQQYGQMSSKSLPESEASLARCAQNKSSNACGPGEEIQPMLSNEWQFCQEFSSLGGILQGEHSDVVLKVPKGAIDVGEYEKIRGAVFTDLPSARRKLKLPEDEMIASPIIEYDAKEGLSFRDRLEISLPHFLPADFNEGSVKVYMFDRDTGGSLRVRKLRPLDKSNLQRDGSESLQDFDVYYFGEDNLLLILVKHFTGYLCTYDCKEKFSPPVLHLKLYANHLETLRGRRRVTVCLKAWDSRMKIRDFTEADQMSLHDQQLMLIEEAVLGRLQPEIVDMASVALGMVLELTEEDEELWMHHRDRRGEITDPAQCVIPMNRFVPCKCQQPYPQVRKWHLLNKAGVTPDVFECSLFVGYVETADEQQSFPLKFLTKTERPHFLISIQKSGEALDVSSNAEGSGSRNKKLYEPQIVNNLAYKGNYSVSEPHRAAGPVTIFKNVQNVVLTPDGHKSSSDKRKASTRPTHSSHPEKNGVPESTSEPSGTARENGVEPSPPFPQEDRSLPPPTQASTFSNDDVVVETDV